MNEPEERRPPSRPSAGFMLGAGLVVVLAFLAGFGWQFLEARSARDERDALETELAFQDLATTLASAVIQAEYGSYEGARELMSRFFTGLQERLQDAPPSTRPELEAILARRDAVITALSRADEESRTNLAHLFLRYRTAFGEMEQGLPLSGPDRPAPAPAGADTAGAA